MTDIFSTLEIGQVLIQSRVAEVYSNILTFK